ncbi:hypothetical protein Agub_g8263 [Astrephomene gubernaculifera]|uniref:Tbc2 translation factor, chloroplastic n=1 Tax=Astrephomene gubernaculifera TaxID=47775 RepID=A0AAD3DTB4_9CHLO|nr:hypothetical protein Agub_g8263 [Astrephomene gubernaculifera]
MQRSCLSSASGHTVGHPCGQDIVCAPYRAVLPSSRCIPSAGNARRAQPRDILYVCGHHAARIPTSMHERRADVVCMATRRATTSASSPTVSSGPAQFILLTDCGSLPSAADVQEMLPNLTPKQLADAVWCFAQHEVKPTPELMHAVAQEIHSKLLQFRAQDLSNTLWAFAMLKYQPTEQWWRDFERQVYGNLPDLTDRQLANLLWGFAVLERRPAPEPPAADAPQEGIAAAAASGTVAECSPASPSCSDRPGWVLGPLLARSCAGGFSGFSAGSLHLLVWSLGKLHHAPPAVWLGGFLAAAEAHFFRFTPTELANIVWALAKLGSSVPSAWLDKLLLVAQWRFPSFPARLLSIVAWSTATLSHRPQQEWLLCFEEQVRAKFLDFSGHELACVAWALRRFGYPTRHNAVFYMLQKQQRFLDADFEVLSNPKLLRQVLGWRGEEAEEAAKTGQGEGEEGGLG